MNKTHKVSATPARKAATPAKVFSKKVSPVTIPHKALAGQSSDVVADVLDVILTEEITSLELQYKQVCGNTKAVTDSIARLLTEYRDGVFEKLMGQLTPLERKFTLVKVTFGLFIKKHYTIIPDGKTDPAFIADSMWDGFHKGIRQDIEFTVDDLKDSIPALEELVKGLHQLFTDEEKLSTRLHELRKRKENAGIIVKRHKIANEYKIDDKSMDELKTMILGETK